MDCFGGVPQVMAAPGASRGQLTEWGIGKLNGRLAGSIRRGLGLKVRSVIVDIQFSSLKQPMQLSLRPLS